MRSLKNHFLSSKRRLYEPYKQQRLMVYLNRHLKRNCKKKVNKDGKRSVNIDRRPKELKYLWISKATGLTYKQVRNRIDKMVKSGIIEKYPTATSYKKNGNFYRFAQK